MDKDVLILILLTAMIVVSIIQTFQVMAFQKAVNELKATSSSTLTATESAGARTQSSGIGGC